MGGQISVLTYEKGESEKNECLEGLEEFLLQIFLPRGLAVFSVKKKRLCKVKYGFENSVSNVDLDMFCPNNQLFTFLTF